MSLNIESPFWTFSLRVYASDGVAAECLALQDRLGLDVNVLLFAAWLGIVRGVTLDEAEMERINKVAAGWSNDVVLPLRAVRRRLKRMPEIAHADVQALRKRVAETELFAEQIEQAFLHQMADGLPAPQAGAGEAALRANLAAVLRSCGADPDDNPLPGLIAAATKNR